MQHSFLRCDGSIFLCLLACLSQAPLILVPCYPCPIIFHLSCPLPSVNSVSSSRPPTSNLLYPSMCLSLHRVCKISSRPSHPSSCLSESPTTSLLLGQPQATLRSNSTRLPQPCLSSQSCAAAETAETAAVAAAAARPTYSHHAHFWCVELLSLYSLVRGWTMLRL